MNDFEQGRDQALANVDAILLDTMRPLIGVDIETYKLLLRLRRRITTLQLASLPAMELRAVGEYPEWPLDPPPAKRWRLTPFDIDPDILESL